MELENETSVDAQDNTTVEASPDNNKESASSARAEDLPPAESAPIPDSAQDVAPEPAAVSPEEFLPFEPETPSSAGEDARLKAVIEAIIYVTDEPLALDQISAALEQSRDRVARLLEQLLTEYEQPDRGLSIREVAGGYKLSTKPEHHDAVRRFVKNLKPALKLSLPALETLAVIAYKQPITAPEIMEIRGVQGAGVLKTLLDRKLIAAAGRKNVVGKPILYKTTREFLVQFGLKDLTELPTLKEFQEIGRFDIETPAAAKETPPVESLGNPASPNASPDSPPPNESPDSPSPREEPPSPHTPVEDPEVDTPVEDPPARPDQPPAEQDEKAQGEKAQVE